MKNNNVFLTLLTLMFVLNFQSCTKKRTAKLPEEQQSEVKSIHTLESTQVELNINPSILSKIAQYLNLSDKVYNVENQDIVGPNDLKFMFENLEIHNPQDTNIKVIFSVDQNYITAYKVNNEISQLSSVEKDIATSPALLQFKSEQAHNRQSQKNHTQINQDLNLIKSQQIKGTLLVPLFKFKVNSFGVIQNKKNELNENTSTLELKETEFSEATHIKLTPRSHARLKIKLPDNINENIFGIYDLGTLNQTQQFNIKFKDLNFSQQDDNFKILNYSHTKILEDSEIFVSSRLNKLFSKLNLLNSKTNEFNVVFSYDKNKITSYKVVTNSSLLNDFEKSIAISLSEAKIIQSIAVSSNSQLTQLKEQLNTARLERSTLLSGQKNGELLVPLFTFPISQFGTIQFETNESGLDTTSLKLEETDLRNATHIVLNLENSEYSREVIGANSQDEDKLKDLTKESSIDRKLFKASELANKLKIGLHFINQDSFVFSKFDSESLLIYQIADISTLNEEQQRLYNTNSSLNRIMSCASNLSKDYSFGQTEKCVLILVASVPVEFYKLELENQNSSNQVNETNLSSLKLTKVPKLQSSGIVKIVENTPAKQEEIVGGYLDPQSTIRISDLKGEFLFRRTFESAAYSFIGRTGTSGDMSIVIFELEDSRLVVRNQQAVTTYVGQTSIDKEELMSIPVEYYRLIQNDELGNSLSLPKLEKTTLNKAEYLKLDWTKNTIPDSTSPLAFYDAGACFTSQSSTKVKNTDLRLETDGSLNFSIASSYSVSPDCAVGKDISGSFWSQQTQFNFNIQERISFKKHNSSNDQQISLNLSPTMQKAFNFEFFTVADKINSNSTLNNRVGSEKYMPMTFDIRNGKKIKWYLGGINNSNATPPEKRKLLVDAAQQVINEWNSTFKMAFKGTPLERSESYIELIVEDAGKERGQLGDLDRNYIWFNEIPADNGLLGVAQPAANPRSGLIESANVIVYTGNTLDQAKAQITTTKNARKYELELEKMKADVVEKIKQQELATKKAEEQQVDLSQPDDQKPSSNGHDKISSLSKTKNLYLNKIKSSNLFQKTSHTKTFNYLSFLSQNMKELKKIVNNSKLNKEEYLSNKKLKKMIGENQLLVLFEQKILNIIKQNKNSFSEKNIEYKINDLFIKEGQLPANAIHLLKQRQSQLAFNIKFDQSQLNRPGCFYYSKNEVEDDALAIHQDDPEKNLMHNFKQAVMSTLSHELGHALGLRHNFMGSLDKANFEHKDEKSNRNYSSIMDYISDIQMNYQGPGPYDTHAIRAGYTGFVELSDDLAKIENTKLTSFTNSKYLINGNMMHISDILKILEIKDTQNLTKYTLNKGLSKVDFPGLKKDAEIIKYYGQCTDEETLTSAYCARFDFGTSGLDIVKNKIQDYERLYINSYHALDRINFGYREKISSIQRAASLFQDIRAFLDEAFITEFYDNEIGLTEEKLIALKDDTFFAAMEGYKFFQKVVKTPDETYGPIPVTYKTKQKNASGQEESSTQVHLALSKPLYDQALKLNDFMSSDRVSLFGTVYDKSFALSILLEANPPKMTLEDGTNNVIAYLDLEKYFLGIKSPEQSAIMNTLNQIFTNNLKYSFYPENSDQPIETNITVSSNRRLDEIAALSTIVNLEKAKWSTFDPFADYFKTMRTYKGKVSANKPYATKAGYNSTQPDSIVYISPQTAKGSLQLIKTSHEAQLLVENKEFIFAKFKQINSLDLTVEFSKDKSSADVKAKKEQADKLASELVAYMKELNKNGEIMDIELDKDDSAENFKEQMAFTRQNYLEFMKNLNIILIQLRTSKNLDDLNLKLDSFIPVLNEMKEANEPFTEFPLVKMMYAYLIETNAKLNFSLRADLPQLPARIIFNNAFSVTKLNNGLRIIPESLEKLSLFSQIIDPDLNIAQ